MRTLAWPKGNYLGELMMKFWGVMTRWRLRYWRPWALEISLSLSLSEFYEMLLIPHCRCRTLSLMSAQTQSKSRPSPSVLLRALYTCRRWERRAWPTLLPAIHHKCRDRMHRSTVKGHQGITLGGWGNSRQAGGDLANPVDQKRSRKAEENATAIIFVLISLNFPLK